MLLLLSAPLNRTGKGLIPTSGVVVRMGRSLTNCHYSQNSKLWRN